MKRLEKAFVLAALAMTLGNAQQMAGVEVGISSGIVFPSSPMAFANYWTMQTGGGIEAGIPLTESISLVGSFEYYRFKLYEQGVSKGFNTTYMRDIWIFKDVSLIPSADPSSVMTASANVRLAPSKPSGMLSPYVIAGGGVMRSSLSAISMPATSTLSINGSDLSMTSQQSITGGEQTTFFFQLGMGLDLRLTDAFSTNVEARYANGLGKGLGFGYVPITLGVRLRM